MKLQAFCKLMEQIAPKEYACDWDNVGLLIGTDREEIRKVLVSLDLTVPVAEEAISGDYDLVLTHHPIFLDPIQRIDPSVFETAAAYRLMRHGIGMFAAHTNLDAAPGGVNDALAEVLGLKDVCPLPPENLGRIGKCSEPIPFESFIKQCESALKTKSRVVGDPNDTVFTVAVIGGSGGSDVKAAYESGCDVLVTGEMKHHQALEAAYFGLHCCVLGHYETENIVLKPLINRLQEASFDVQYHLTQSGKAPLPCPQGGNRYE